MNEEALANELTGYFYLDTGMRIKSMHYFSQAFEKYSEWGALAKARMLTKYLDTSASVSIRVYSNHINRCASTISTCAYYERLDI